MLNHDQINILIILLPVFLLVLLGFILRQRNFPGEAFWAPAEKLTYYLLFPALLVHKIAAPGTSEGIEGVMPLFTAFASLLIVVSALLLLLRPRFFPDGPPFTSVYQGVLRFNSYIGLSIVLFLYGERGIVAAAMLLAFLIPAVNILCIVVLVRFGKEAETKAFDRSAFFQAVATNPVVLACFVGVILRNTGMSLPQPASNLLDILGRAALPLGLLTVGARLEPATLKNGTRLIVSATMLKLLASPALAWLFCLLFAVPPFPASVAIIFAALPGSALSVILARQLGGDGALVSGIVTAQTIVAAITLPLILRLLAG